MVQIWTCKVCACALFSFYAHHYSRFFQISSKNHEGILIPNIRETLFKLPIIEWFHSRNLRIFNRFFFLFFFGGRIFDCNQKIQKSHYFILAKKYTLQHLKFMVTGLGVSVFWQELVIKLASMFASCAQFFGLW